VVALLQFFRRVLREAVPHISYVESVFP
jgi:hypothetical protein